MKNKYIIETLNENLEYNKYEMELNCEEYKSMKEYLQRYADNHYNCKYVVSEV